MLLPEYTIEVERQIDTGHRVLGHEGKCRFLHGHTYTISVELMSHQLLPIGFVADFGDIKEIIDRWDHRFLLWSKDPITFSVSSETTVGVVRVPFNPTAENMAWWLANQFLQLENIQVAEVDVSETESTIASYCARR